ncbi:hypothetical protein F5Y15DRAFT_426760 [Xylariaceae sp. FL0016]|nr:hypothetical protein F5Y15DRAFT_426760 [Xylariaceae sp. FL0016]
MSGKAVRRSKALGLKLNTNIPTTFSTEVVKNDQKFADIATAPAHKKTFEVSSDKPAKSKHAEAMLNTDWRNNRRQAGSSDDGNGMGVVGTAPAHKLTFSQNETKQPKNKQLLVAAIADSHGLRRYRDAPVDDDLIISAPATKLEFDDAFKRDEPESAGLEAYPHTKMSCEAMKPFVHLDATSPKTREGYSKILGWDSITSVEQDGQAAPSSSIVSAKVTGSLISPWMDLNFPMSEIRDVKRAKRFQSGADTEDGLKKLLFRLTEPRTAGLPPKQMREMYEEDQRILKSELFNSSKLEKPLVDNELGYIALLSKLQKSANSRLAAQQSRQPTIEVKEPTVEIKNAEVEIQKPATKVQRSLSHDSGVSGVSTESRKSSKLNPTASEFCSTPKEQENAMVKREPTPNPLDPMRGYQFLGESAAELHQRVLFLETENLMLKASTSYAQTQEREARLRAQKALVQAEEAAQEAVDRAEHTIMQHLADQLAQARVQAATRYAGGRSFLEHNDIPGLAGYSQEPTYSNYMRGPGGSGANPGTHNTIVKNATATTKVAPNPQVHLAASAAPAVQPSEVHQIPPVATVIPNTQASQGPQSHHNTMQNPGVTSQQPVIQGVQGYGSQTQQEYNFNNNNYQGGPMMIPTGHSSNGQPQFIQPATHQAAPSGYPNAAQPQSFHSVVHQPGVVAPVAPVPGIQASWVKDTFRPKPVRKPIGQAVPGDPRSTMSQQQYEEYLEHRRATDPNYAMKCKQRQARRVGRQRGMSGTNGAPTMLVSVGCSNGN